MLFMHLARAAASRTFWTAGRSSPMRMAIIAITTNSSINVNSRRREYMAVSVRGGETASGPGPGAGSSAEDEDGLSDQEGNESSVEDILPFVRTPENSEHGPTAPISGSRVE